MNIKQFINKKLSIGKRTFTIDEISLALQKSKHNISSALLRYKKSGELVSPMREFYIIVTPENRRLGSEPATYFIDDYMEFLKAKYYIGLLSAAMYHGAAHQQPQVLQVITNKPIKDILLGKVKIQFIKKKEINDKDYQIKPTNFTNILISTPEITIMDLITNSIHCGGFNNIATILEELSPEVDPIKLELLLEQQPNIAWKQRLGYMLEYLEIGNLANVCRKYINKQKRVDYILFNPYNRAKSKKDYPYNKNWKIIENEIIESDL